MLTTIGRKREAVDAVDSLLECHERIRRMSALARRLGEAEGAPEAEVREAAEHVRRYFAESLPVHARDEDESIVPRLRGLDAALDAALATMSREHEEHRPGLAELDAVCAALAAAPARHAGLRGRLARVAADLERLFAEHLAIEETTIFPALRARLDAGARAAIAAEMRARRGA